MTLLKADKDQMDALVTTLNNVAANIDAIDVRSAATAVAGAFPGTPLGATSEQATEYTEGAWLRVSQRVQEVAHAITNSVISIYGSDEDFARYMRTFDFEAQENQR